LPQAAEAVDKVNQDPKSRLRYFEKTGSLLSISDSSFAAIKPQGAPDFKFTLTAAEMEAARDKGKGQPGRDEEEREGKDDDKDEKKEKDDEEEDEGEDDDDEVEEPEEDDDELDKDIAPVSFKEALPPGAEVIASAPALTKQLVGKRIVFHFNVGWVVGRVKKFYPKLREGVYNYQVSYADGIREQHIRADLYGHAASDSAPQSAWILLKK
jgi:hypothetical protein